MLQIVQTSLRIHQCSSHTLQGASHNQPRKQVCLIPNLVPRSRLAIQTTLCKENHFVVNRHTEIKFLRTSNYLQIIRSVHLILPTYKHSMKEDMYMLKGLGTVEDVKNKSFSISHCKLQFHCVNLRGMKIRFNFDMLSLWQKTGQYFKVQDYFTLMPQSVFNELQIIFYTTIQEWSHNYTWVICHLSNQGT